ncbi:transmembrane channel-like protein 3 [Anoplophora glabripennis]|uniref:transmembrane channel-like protein 3 n=1 Tax=Anoplophora glabripennis TaxID=217634 RepID=UPI000873F334|nr:transmembrane channel-like protein 3 [Anoplophora glabripennis]
MNIRAGLGVPTTGLPPQSLAREQKMLTVDPKTDSGRKFTLEEEKYNATNFLTLWDFEGVFKYSPLFYGWYTNNESTYKFYRLPLAYFMTGLAVYAYSFFATLRKMAENSRMSKLSEKDDEYIFSWKLFTAWDYMIGNAETAHNRVASIVMGFKEALLEEAEKKRESRKWKVVCFRVFVNLIVLGLLTFSAFAVVMVVKRSTEKEANSTVWRKNEITIVMSLITLFFPMLFEVLGLAEQYHPRKQLRLQLARIMVLNLLNLYSLIFALFDKISFMTREMHKYKNISCTETSESTYLNLYSTTVSYFNSSSIYDDTKKIKPPVSESLVYDMAFNISNLTDFPLLQLIDLIKTAIIDLNISNITDSFTTEYPENSSLINVTDTLFIIPSFSNLSMLNDTGGNFTEYNLTDFKDMFVDYLTYLLLSFSNNNTDVNNFTVAETDVLNFVNKSNIDILGGNFNINNITTIEADILNITDRSDIDFVGGNSDIIRSILSPLLENISRKYYEEQDLTTIYNAVITIISFKNNRTITENSNCQKITLPSESTGDLTTPFSTTEIITGNYSMCATLRSYCWETMFGQELIKLTVMDLVMTILSTLAIDFFRGIFVRVMNRCWCWDLEKKFPQYGDFKVAENILHLVNNQGMVWMGMFFSPGLVVLNVIKLYIMMYFRAWAVLTCNVPHEVIFRASRSNNFYYALLLMMLFLCVLPVGYAIVWIKPSWHCGPFSEYDRIFHIFTRTIKNTVPEPFQRALDYIASPGIVIPLLVLLILIIYYLISLTGALREANDDLKIQLRRERTEERRKMFQIVDRRRVGSGESNELSNTPFSKWKKLLGNLPSGKTFDDTPKQESEDLPQPVKKAEHKNKDFLTKFIKKALGKSSTSEEEQNAEDGTDTEQHDSLPYDTMASKNLHRSVRPSLSWNSSDFQGVVSRAMKANQGRLSNQPRESVDSVDTKQSPIQRYDSFEPKRTFPERVVPSTSRDMRQDSGSSVWSENIPVITISKTESAENILMETNTSTETENIRKNVKANEQSKFLPKIKSVLKKQSTEIDEDTICHFNRDLESNLKNNKFIKALAEEDVDYSFSENKDITENSEKCSEKVSDQSSSEDTEFKETSIDTILNFPSNTNRLFSSEEKTLSDDSIEHFSQT